MRKNLLQTTKRHHNLYLYFVRRETEIEPNQIYMVEFPQYHPGTLYFTWYRLAGFYVYHFTRTGLFRLDLLILLYDNPF